MRVLRLGDICSITGGGTPSKKNSQYYKGDIPWATVKDFKGRVIYDTEEHISAEAVAESATNIIKEGTVLLVTRMGLGKVAVAGRDVAINQDVKAINPSGNLDKDYLFWFLLSSADKIRRMGSGATVKGVKLEDIRSLQIPVPTLTKQKAIASLLIQADGIVQLRCKAQQRAMELIPALFVEMFGDPVTNPKGWPKVKLGSVGDVQGGLQVSRSRHVHSYIAPYLRVANVYRGVLNLSAIKNIRLSMREWDRTKLRKGDLLVVEGHGNKDEVGRVAIWDGSIAGCVHQNHLIRVRLDGDRIDSQYACSFLNSLGGRQEILRNGKTTSGLNTISTRNVKDVEILLPPIKEQLDFSQRVKEVFSIQNQQAAALEKAQETFDALLARFFGAAPLGVQATNDPVEVRPVAEPARGARAKRKPTPPPASPAVHPSVEQQLATRPDPSETILAAMRPDTPYARADLAPVLGLTQGQWNAAITQLKDEGKVRQIGDKRGARYWKVEG